MMLLAAACICVSVPADAASAARWGSQACGSSAQVVDYSRPFRSMPFVSKLPASEKLPFGPGFLSASISPGTISSEGVLNPGQQVVLYLSAGAAKPNAKVGLSVETELKEVNARGRVLRVVRAKVLNAQTADDLEQIAISVPRVRAFYRLDFAFSNLAGRRLRTYSNYLRALPARPSARVLLAPGPVLPGSELRWRIANLGTTTISSGAAFFIERKEGTGWVPEPFVPTSFPEYAFYVPAGWATDCERFKLPEGLPAGRYRVSKDVRLADRNRRISAAFMIR